MIGDEMSRGMNPQNRKFTTPNKYNEKHSYSPSANYSYNYNGNGNSQGYGNHQPQSHSKPRRPDNKFKGGGGHHSSNDKLIKQNDQIIKLLKEIRDRLPPPPEGAVAETEAELDQDQIIEAQDEDTSVGNERDQSEDEDLGDTEDQNFNPIDSQDIEEPEER